MGRAVLRAVVFALAVAGCSHDNASGSARPSSSAEAPHATPAAAPKGTLALGEPIASPFVALAEIAKSPSRYQNRVVTTRGKVTSVCQAMGCWMELADDAGHAHVRMHGHAFFVPKTAAGHVARVQATVLPGETTECEDSPAPASGAIAKVELDATGVELDPVSSSL
ncbi:MAG TPA: DUF4920 domain-containing protein [Polyangiaceae bacterium]|jgi:hypothetical protein